MSDTNHHNLFELRGISKSFGRQQVLRGIDLEIPRGKTTVVIGASGCGKSVLLKHLIVLLRPDHGNIFFDGERIDNLRENRLIDVRRRVGYLFQAGALFDSQTVAQNIAFSLIEHTQYTPEEINQLVRDKLELVGMAGFEQRLPSELSGGQQRRVALARAIALSPEVILYDEPTTGLDPIRADIINELIIKLQRGRLITSVVVTHDMNSAYKIGDRIIMLHNGEIIADGDPEAIQQSEHPDVRRFIRGESRREDH
ncbi:MAG: ABC transporter ATP-binding protein [Sedimentisphaerales bacterium]|nr:ABC transporter ATP-binding protein [Sedimentisphaerales bacterium]